VFGMIRASPLPLAIGSALILGGALFILAWWARPEFVPTYAGTLTPRSTLLFSPKGGGTVPKMQIGDSGVFLVGGGGEIGALLFPALRESQFKIEGIDGAIKVSTRVTDENGNLIAELIRNDWKVAPSPGSWDRNYTDDALEVKDAQGNVTLQVRAFFDRIQIQGAWWIVSGSLIPLL